MDNLIIPSVNNLNELIFELEKATGFRNIKVAKRHDSNRWTFYTRYTDRDNKWQTNFIGGINSNGSIYLNKVNSLGAGLVNVNILPEESVRDDNGAGNAAAAAAETGKDAANPFEKNGK